MVRGRSPSIVQCGRRITDSEIELIKETVSLFPNLSHQELFETICEHLGWHTAAGTNKTDACRKLLDKLDSLGIIEDLPEKRQAANHRSHDRPLSMTARTDPQPDIVGTVHDIGEVELEVVKDDETTALWKEYMSRYHYLGYKKPFGFHLRYFIRYREGMLGCVLFSGAAKSIGVRDRWIGWTENQRLRNLAWVINNSRLLIFPWVKVKNLSSHVLGQISRRIRGDWQDRWGYRPLLMETFVDPDIYGGTSYHAANWICLGMTTGEGLVRKAKSYYTTAKKIYVKPLKKDFRKLLCQNSLVGMVEK